MCSAAWAAAVERSQLVEAAESAGAVQDVPCSIKITPGLSASALVLVRPRRDQDANTLGEVGGRARSARVPSSLLEGLWCYAWVIYVQLAQAEGSGPGPGRSQAVSGSEKNEPSYHDWRERGIRGRIPSSPPLRCQQRPARPAAHHKVAGADVACKTKAPGAPKTYPLRKNNQLDHWPGHRQIKSQKMISRL